MEKIVKKIWGEEHWIVNIPKYCGKFLIVNKDSYSSYHYHPIKEETFHLVEGYLKIIIEGELKDIKPGDTIHLKPGTKHSFYGVEKSKILEISTTHSDDDVVRLRKSGKECTKHFLKLKD